MRCALLLSLLAVGCGADASTGDAGECVPITCADADCGALDDGCGGTLECSACALGEICGLAAPNRCGECASDADCSAGEHCDTSLARCSADCRTGSDLALALPSHPVEIEITLAGDALPAEPWADASLNIVVAGGSIDGSTGVWVPLYERLDTGSAPRDRVPANLPPGDYEVRYTATPPPGSELPSAFFARLSDLHVEASDAAVAIDIPVARLTVRPRLASAPLPAPSGTWTRAPSLFVGAGTPLALYVHDGTALGAAVDELTVPVIPGEIQIAYDSGSEDVTGDFPQAAFTPLSTIDVSGDVAIEVDIPRVRVDLELRIDGVAASPGAHELWLSRRTTPATRVMVPASGHAELPLVPGDYALDYRGDAATGSPDGPFTTMLLDTDGTYVVDVPTTLATFHVHTTAGPPPTCEPSATVSVGQLIRLGPSDATTTVTARLVSGTYRPLYDSNESGCDTGDSGWPRGALALDAILLAPGTVDVDLLVPRRALSVQVDLGGAPPPSIAPSGDLDEAPPRLRFAVSDAGEGLGGVDVWLYDRTTGAPSPAQTSWLHDRAYDVAYVGGSGAAYEAEWPVGRRRLASSFDVASGPLMIDVARARAHLALTLGVAPLPSPLEDAWSFHPPVVRFTDAEGEEARLAIYTERGGLPTWPRDVWLVPGVYDLSFDSFDDGFPGRTVLFARSGLPPLGVELGCWELR